MGKVLQFQPAPRPLDRLAARASAYVRNLLRKPSTGKSRTSALSPVGKLLASREMRQALQKHFGKEA